MSKAVKVSCIVAFALLVSFCTYRLCYFLAEKYFFDKIFYQKSIAHGYGLFYNPKLTIKDFGPRAQDLVDLYQHQPSVLGAADFKNYYHVIVVGDSFTWGQGIRNEQRFVNLLSQKLNQVRPTEVKTFALPGWNILDYVNIYNQIKQQYYPDLIIFALVDNDNLINHSDTDSYFVQECLKINPFKSPNYAYDITNLDPVAAGQMIQKLTAESWSNSVNNCILNIGLQQLPTKNSIYFLTQDYDGTWASIKAYKTVLNDTHKYVISSNLGENFPQYKPYFSPNQVNSNFVISSREGHPNALANQMYADILFKEITSNSQWHFQK